MAITYGGQELVQPSAAVLEWAERMLDVGGPWDTPPHIPRGGAALQRLPHVQNAPTDEPGVNILCWPRGASRYAYGHFIIHETQLAVVRAEAYAGSSYNALQFIFSDGIRAVSPYLYMLPPRPIAAPDASENMPGLYLITLVDHRYFWHYKGVAGTALDTTTWSSLYSSIGTALGVTITADSVHSEYSVPPDSFAVGYQSLPAILDAVASSCGHVIVRTLEGDVLAMNADTSGVRLTDNVTATALTVRLAGGIIGFDTSDRASVIPSSVTVCFGRLDEAGEPYAKEVTLASLSLINYSTTIPFVGTKILYHPTRADYSADPPTNQATLDLIANRMAIDWYKFRFGRFEARLEGAIAWPMEGHTDRVYFDHSREAITTCGVTTRLAIPPWLEPTSDCGEDPSSGVAGTLTVDDTIGTGPYTGVTHLTFSSSDAFILSPGSPSSTINVSIHAADETQHGLVTGLAAGTQRWAGLKVFASGLESESATRHTITSSLVRYSEESFNAGGISEYIVTTYAASNTLGRVVLTPGLAYFGGPTLLISSVNAGTTMDAAYGVVDSANVSHTGQYATVSGLVFKGGLYVSGSLSVSVAWGGITGIPPAVDALSPLTPAADLIAYYTGATTAVLTAFTAAGIALVGASSLGAAADLLTAGPIATQVFGP